MSKSIYKSQIIANILDNHSQDDVIYTGFSKTFDKLDYVLPLKLDTFGFDECTFYRNYLSNRDMLIRVLLLKSFLLPLGSSKVQFQDHYCLTSILTVQHGKIFTVVNDISYCSTLQSALSKVNMWCSVKHVTLNVM